MTDEKTFEAINKLKDIEIELHRLKNALEMANRALDAQRTWVGLTDEELPPLVGDNGKYMELQQVRRFYKYIEAKLKEKNT